MTLIKKAGIILAQVILLTSIGLLGEFIVKWFHIPIPGSLLGMFILLGLLLTKIIKLEWVELGAAVLIGDLLLFFIPSAIGIINYSDLFGKTGLLLVGVVIVSILLVIISVVVSMRFLTTMQRKGLKL